MNLVPEYLFLFLVLIYIVPEKAGAQTKINEKEFYFELYPGEELQLQLDYTSCRGEGQGIQIERSEKLNKKSFVSEEGKIIEEQKFVKEINMFVVSIADTVNCKQVKLTRELRIDHDTVMRHISIRYHPENITINIKR